MNMSLAVCVATQLCPRGSSPQRRFGVARGLVEDFLIVRANEGSATGTLSGFRPICPVSTGDEGVDGRPQLSKVGHGIEFIAFESTKNDDTQAQLATAQAQARERCALLERLASEDRQPFDPSVPAGSCEHFYELGYIDRPASIAGVEVGVAAARAGQGAALNPDRIAQKGAFRRSHGHLRRDA